MKRKVTYIISRVDHSLGFEMVAEGLSEVELHFILLNNAPSPLEEFLVKRNFKVVRFKVNSRLNLMKAFVGILLDLAKNRPYAIHCHNRFAYLLGITAGWLLRIKKRIYTRHHSTLQHQYYPSKVKYDKWVNHMSTDIVAISENVKSILCDVEGVKEDKISMVHHGFYLERFTGIPQSRIEELRRRHLITKRPVIGVISRFINWKGVEYVIRAFESILEHHPKAILLMANASGPNESEIRDELKRLPKEAYKLIPYERDIYALYAVMDVFVHVPIDAQVEAFGQIYIESLASGVPSVFTLSGVAQEFIKDHYNALVVDFKNADQISNAVNEILSNDDLRKELSSNGMKSVQRFSKESFIKTLSKVYHD